MNSKAIILIVGIIVVVAAACAVFVLMGNNSSHDEDITLILGTKEDTGPISTTSSSFYEQRRMIVQEPLIAFGTNQLYENMTLEKSTTQDNLTWNLKLKSGIVWSDGEKYTANDVKQTINIYSIARANVVANIESVTVVDDLNLTLVLKTAASDLGGTLSNIPILPWHIWESYNIKTAEDYQKVTDINAFIGTGPYKVKSLNATGDELTYVYNEKYRDGKPNVTTIILKHYGEESAMIAALLAGEIDAVYNYGSPGVNASYLEKIEEAKNLDYLKVVTGGVPADILFNMRNSISLDPDFRKAVKYALDYEQIIKYVAPATGSVANAGLVPSTIDGYIETEKLGINLSKAEACMKDYFKTYGLDWNKDKVNFDVLIVQKNDLFTNIFTLMKEQLAKINIVLNSIDIGTQSVVNVARDPSTAATLFFMTDAAIKNYAGFASHYISATGTLQFVYGATVQDEDYEKIVDGMLVAKTDAEKKNYAKQFQEYYEENVVAIPLYWGAYIQPYNVKYEGWTCSAASGLLCYENLFNLKAA